jgi:molybdopterin converting factor subunit 1
MILQIRLFARARDLAGTDIVAVAVAEGATAADLRAALARLHPSLAGLLERCALAVNAEFVPPSQVLQPADEIALLPPVSGG